MEADLNLPYLEHECLFFSLGGCSGYRNSYTLPLCLTYSTCQSNWSFGANLLCLTSLKSNILGDTSEHQCQLKQHICVNSNWLCSTWLCSNVQYMHPKYYPKLHECHFTLKFIFFFPLSFLQIRFQSVLQCMQFNDTKQFDFFDERGRRWLLKTKGA